MTTASSCGSWSTYQITFNLYGSNVATLEPDILQETNIMLATLKTTDVRSRIEPEIKDRATAVLASCGLNLSDAIRLFLRQVVATTRAAMQEAHSMRKAKFDSAHTLFNDLEKNSTTKTRKAVAKQR
jgi:DNA-damage-inducible protein J